MVSKEDVVKWIIEWEGPTLDFKLKDILSNGHKLAKTMVAFGNNKFVSEDFGGKLVIGVHDKTKIIEGFEYDPKHEEHIMNIARDKCYPSINPNFEKVDVGEGKVVYVITIPKMTTTPYQQITPEGNVHWIRVGTTIRSPTFNELSLLYNEKQDIKNKENDITKLLPPVYEAIRRLIVIPIDANSKILTFDRNTVDLLGTNSPRFVSFGTLKLVQNTVHYVGSFRERDYNHYGVIDNFGRFCFEEVINENKVIHIGRDVVFLTQILNYLHRIYLTIGYSGRLEIKYGLFSVQKFPVTTESSRNRGWGETHICQLSDVKIERAVSVNSLDPKIIAGSIIEEIARACDWPVNEGDFSKFIDNVVEECGM